MKIKGFNGANSESLFLFFEEQEAKNILSN